MSFLPSLPEEADDTIFYGVVNSVDHANGLAVVDLGDMLTPPIRWAALRAGKIRIFIPPSEGEQVKVVAPNGDFEGAIIEYSIFTDETLAGAAGENIRIILENNDEITITPDGEVNLQLSTALNINAPQVNIHGEVNITGKLTATDDVIGGGKSLKSHKHTGVASGASVSGAPQ